MEVLVLLVKNFVSLCSWSSVLRNLFVPFLIPFQRAELAVSLLSASCFKQHFFDMWILFLWCPDSAPVLLPSNLLLNPLVYIRSLSNDLICNEYWW